MAPIDRTIQTTTHGRYLVAPGSNGAPILAGFHGYAEAAAVHFDRMHAIPGANLWTIISIQGLHRFYQRRTNEVVASWMTREDRELAIADNRAYVAATIDAEAGIHGSESGVVLAGFSQGVAMAFRAATAVRQPILGVISVGGDVPPELTAAELARLNHALLMRGARDPVYTTETFRNDQRRLREAGVQVTAIEFDGGHEWPAPVLDAASAFLHSRRP